MTFLDKFTLPEDPTTTERATPVNKFYNFFGLDSSIPFDHDRTVSSPYIRPLTLGIIRLVIGVYMLISFIIYFSLLAAQENKFLRKQAWKLFGDIMFHSFLGLTAYMLVSACHTLSYVRWKKNLLSKWSRWLQLSHLFLQTTILTFPLFCTIIYLYWTLQALPGWYTRPLTGWSTITFYMLNTFFSFTE